MAGPNQKDWREVCAAVANETDSNKLHSLVQQLIKIKALDEGERNWRSRLTPAANSEASCSSWSPSVTTRHVSSLPRA